MPVYKDNNFIHRIKFGNEEIRRVYKGNELQYGLYDVLYKYGSELPESVTLENAISKYVWGLEYPLPNEEGVEYRGKIMKLTFNKLSAPENYLYHWYGWYLYNKSGNKEYIENIGKDFHKNLNLFSHWSQKDFRYSGIYHYQTWEPGFEVIDEWPGSPGGYDKPDESNEYYDWSVYKDWRSKYSRPTFCTWYVNGRTGEVSGGHFAPTGAQSVYWDANRWLEEAAAAGEEVHYVGDGYIPKAGDVAVFGGERHVMFIEEVNGNSSTVTHMGSIEGIGWKKSQWTLGDHPPDFGGDYPFLGYINWHKYVDGRYIDGYESVSETSVEDQENPQAIEPDIPYEAEPLGWSEITSKTYIRDCEYDYSGYSSWGNWNMWKEETEHDTDRPSYPGWDMENWPELET